MKGELEKYFDRLWPIARSITGNGLRESFRILQEIAPYELSEVPSGTSCFDWQIPDEWNIRDAYIITPEGTKIADFKVNNLHVVNYSVPVDMELSYDQLLPHLHFKEDLPDAIPYYTSYYKRSWGFCISYTEFLSLPRKGTYKVYIDSDLKAGGLTYGQVVLPGASDKEVIFSSYLCHPSMANNELSGPLALSFLYREIQKIENRYFTCRFILAPETIGIIAFLAQHGETLRGKVHAGYVLTCCGDNGKYNYKRSKDNSDVVNVVAEQVLLDSGSEYAVRNFSVGGSDERQYCSPGFNWPVGSLMRTPYQEYPEYHTSADNKSILSFEALEETVHTHAKIYETLNWNRKYKAVIQHCEPHLAKYDVVPDQHEAGFDRHFKHRLLHLLSFADGRTDLLDIAAKRNESMALFIPVVKLCLAKGLLHEN